MPGGNPAAMAAYERHFPGDLRQSRRWNPCCDWGGRKWRRPLRQDGPQRHRYGDMQLICEAYDLLQRGLGLKADELAEVFTEWNKVSWTVT